MFVCSSIVLCYVVSCLSFRIPLQNAIACFMVLQCFVLEHYMFDHVCDLVVYVHPAPLAVKRGEEYGGRMSGTSPKLERSMSIG